MIYMIYNGLYNKSLLNKTFLNIYIFKLKWINKLSVFLFAVADIPALIYYK
jgi:hypothetical protein